VKPAAGGGGAPVSLARPTTLEMVQHRGAFCRPASSGAGKILRLQAPVAANPSGSSSAERPGRNIIAGPGQVVLI